MPEIRHGGIRQNRRRMEDRPAARSLVFSGALENWNRKGFAMDKKAFWQREWVIPFGFALLACLILLVTNALDSYGIFRDEYYFLACSRHLALGYVDQPPLSIYFLAVSRVLFGDSLFAIRLLPALIAGAIVFLTGLMAKRMGGGKTALVIAGLTAGLAPFILGQNSHYSINSWSILFWALAAYLTILLFKTDNPRIWLPLGLVIGLGLLNKIDMLWFVFGLVDRRLVIQTAPASHQPMAVPGRPHRPGAFSAFHDLEYPERFPPSRIHAPGESIEVRVDPAL